MKKPATRTAHRRCRSSTAAKSLRFGTTLSLPSQTPKHAPALAQLRFPIVVFKQSEFAGLGDGFGVQHFKVHGLKFGVLQRVLFGRQIGFDSVR
jgi:hypothetical protein